MMQWLMANWGIIASILLGISELLAVIFPAGSGAGGIIAGIIQFLKNLGAKDPLGK